MTDDLIDQLRDPQTTQVAGQWLRALVLQAADRIEELERAFNATDIMISQFLAVPPEMERLHARIEELEAALQAAEATNHRLEHWINDLLADPEQDGAP